MTLPSEVASYQVSYYTSNKEYQEAKRRCAELLRAGSFEKAIYENKLDIYDITKAFKLQINNAAKAGDHEAVMRLYKAFFEFYPFGNPFRRSWYWNCEGKYWGSMAIDYCGFKKTFRNLATTPGEDQDSAAAELFRAIVDSYEKGDMKSCAERADEIITKYPKSIFCGPAALYACAEDKKANEKVSRIPFYENYHEKLEKAHCTPRNRVLLDLSFVSEYRQNSKAEDIVRKRISALREVEKLSEISFEKRQSLIAAGETALEAGEPSLLEEGREEFYRYLKRYPEGPEVDSARMGIVQSYCQAGNTDEALSVLRKLESSSPKGTDFGSELFG